VNWDYSGRLQKAQLDVVELTPDLDAPVQDGSSGHEANAPEGTSPARA
jgi:hypothetical protein